MYFNPYQLLESHNLGYIQAFLKNFIENIGMGSYIRMDSVDIQVFFGKNSTEDKTQI